jgi:hypothetical protein
MLKVEDIDAIKDYCDKREHSGRQAARVFQRSRNTVAKVLREGVEGFRRQKGLRRRRRVVLEPHQKYIDGVLEGREGGRQHGKQKHNAITITNHLREHLDYRGSVSQVRRYLQRRRGELGLIGGGKIVLDRVKESNGLCEADWTEVKIYLAGAFITIWLLVVRIRYSGVHFVRGYRAMDTESLLDGLQRSFEWFGGVPTVVQLDNQKAAVVKLLKGRARQETEAYKAFRAHHGFRAQFTMRSSPDENGTVEASMGPVARWLVPAVARMDDLNGYLLHRCEAYKAHQIQDRSAPVGELFDVERNLLIPLPHRRYDTGRERRVGVNQQSRFLYRGVWYSVPLAYRGRKVVAKGYAEEVLALCDGQLIARHQRAFEPGNKQLDPLHFLPALRQKPNQLDHAEAFHQWQLPLIYERFREELERRGDGGLVQYVEILGYLSQFGQSQLSAALRRANGPRGRKD